MSKYADKRCARRSWAVLLPWTLSLTCAACTQAPGAQQPDGPLQPRTALASAGHTYNSTGAPEFDTGEGADPDNQAAPPLNVQGDDADQDAPSTDGDVTADGEDTESTLRASAAEEATGQSDRDGDGVVDRAESNSGVFVDFSDTGTDPDNPDTDSDGLSDGDEVWGTAQGLDLPALGVSPLHRDLLLEYDWIEDNEEECGQHSHEPSATAVVMVATAFANAPVMNPDGSSGINVIYDYGQGDPFTGGTLVTGVPALIEGTADDAAFQSYKAANMAPNRVGYFHYALMAHRFIVWDDDAQEYTLDPSGVAELPGTGFMVTLACDFDDFHVGNTIMHELGHNLGLRHGGDEDRNNKPNYNSIMNYAYQGDGVDVDCVLGGDQWLDYSSNRLASLQETKLNEYKGICNDVPVDWNDNKVIELEVEFDINEDGELTELHDFDDWALIVSNKTLVRSAVVDTSTPPLCPPLRRRL